MAMDHVSRGVLLGLAVTVFSSSPHAAEVVGEKRSLSSALEEVLVTARKRAENIQETPVAVTAISGDDLRAQGILSTSELSKAVPSLQINDSTAPQIFIRGIGQRAPMARFDPSVSVYLDGIFIPRPDGQLLDTIDIESVQVLRGPQGTLFGKNNTGGALVFTLIKPGEEPGGYVEGALGNYGEQRVRAALDMPVSDEFLTRLALASHRRDGFLRDPSSSNNQSVDRLSAIFQTRWLASDAITLDTMTFLGKTRERFPSYHCSVINEDALFINGLGILWPGDTDPSNPSAYQDNCKANDRDSLPDLVTNQGPTQHQIKHQDTLMFGATLNWELNENHSLKTILGYRDAIKKGPQQTADEGGPEAFLRGIVLDDADQESLTLELQLNGQFFDGAVEYATGVFWQDEFKSERYLLSSPLVGIDAINLAQLAAGRVPDASLIPPGGSAPPIVGALVPLDTLQDFDIDGETLAIFTQATWHINEQFELTLGGRYTEEDRQSELITRTSDLAAVTDIVSADPRFLTLDPAMGLLTYLGIWAEDPISLANDILKASVSGEVGSPLGAPVRDYMDSTFKEFTPMASGSWLVPDAWLDGSFISSGMAYATWSNGFKSGFHEPSGVDGLLVVEPESLENREIGFKVDALEHSLRVNVALYSMTFENMQLITVGLDSANSLVVTSQNAGKSMIEGGEIEILWLPSPEMLVSLTYSNNNYKFLEFDDVALTPLAVSGEKVVLDRSDEEFAVSPRQSASLGVQYTIVSDIGLIVPRFDLSYKGETYMGFDDGSWEVTKTNPGAVYADDYILLDARLSWTNINDDLSIAAYVKNLTDERYDIGAVATGESLGTFARVLGEPRFYGVEVRKTF
ncbi:TonB-dependent receptor [Zhongshania aliphaticivorans]|uniref:TonB-dependent receptor n=1 Tax=Zhongshania aliphaticivorans TaxID=1470434 RepID=UPI0039C97238